MIEFTGSPASPGSESSGSINGAFTGEGRALLLLLPLLLLAAEWLLAGPDAFEFSNDADT